MKNLATIVLIGVLAGCVSDGGIYEESSTEQQFSGELSITKECDNWSSDCVFSYTLKNSTNIKSYIRPELRVFVTDCAGNTLDETTVYFDTIYLGREQTKTSHHPKSKDGTTRISVQMAKSGWQSYNGTTQYLNGIHGVTYNWGCN